VFGFGGWCGVVWGGFCLGGGVLVVCLSLVCVVWCVWAWGEPGGGGCSGSVALLGGFVFCGGGNSPSP